MNARRAGVLAWALTAILGLGGGALCQWLLFGRSTPGWSWLWTWPALWLAYLLIALALGERIHRRLSRFD